MDVTRLAIPDVILITPKRIEGYRAASSAKPSTRARLAEVGITEPISSGQSLLLHWPPAPSAASISSRSPSRRTSWCGCRVAPFSMSVVDIRRGSPTFGQHVSGGAFGRQLGAALGAEGVRPGICTLEPNTEVVYKVTAYYSAASDKGLAFDDPALGIEWPVPLERAVVSDGIGSPDAGRSPRHLHLRRRRG